MSRFTDPIAYENGVGRLSRPLARDLVGWLGAARDASWLDVGCGTGAVSSAVIDLAWPGSVTGIDSAGSYVERARDRVAGARFLEGSAAALPFAASQFDVTTASLLLSNVAEPEAAMAEMARVTARGGMVAITVWEGLTYPTRAYWDTVAELSLQAPEARDPRGRLPNDQRSVHETLGAAGLHDIHTTRFEIQATFESFEAFWNAVILQGHAAVHLETLPEAALAQLKERVSERMGAGTGPVGLDGRAWAGRAVKP